MKKRLILMFVTSLLANVVAAVSASVLENDVQKRRGKKAFDEKYFYFLFFIFSLSSLEMPGVNVDEIVSAVIASIRSEKDGHKKLNVFLSYPFFPSFAVTFCSFSCISVEGAPSSKCQCIAVRD